MTGLTWSLKVLAALLLVTLVLGALFKPTWYSVLKWKAFHDEDAYWHLVTTLPAQSATRRTVLFERIDYLYSDATNFPGPQDVDLEYLWLQLPSATTMQDIHEMLRHYGSGNRAQRMFMLRGLSSHIKKSETALSFVKKAASADPDEDVRRHAQSLVDGLPKTANEKSWGPHVGAEAEGGATAAAGAREAQADGLATPSEPATPDGAP